MEVPIPPNPADVHFMHKNRLQEHAQRASIPLPLYSTVNEGSPHAPKFRASVLIDGARFTSSSTFNNRKAAEQEVARVAFEELSRKIKPETIPLIHNDLSYCKSILHEYCAKKKLERPTYNTCALAGSPVFSCTAVFCEIKYTGLLGRSKREAEQMAARAVIEAVLGNSEGRNCMYEIIKSKCKLIAAIHSISGSHLVQGMISKVDVDNLNANNVIEKKEEAIVLTNNKLPASSYPGQPAIAVPVESSFLEVKKLEHKSIPEHHSTLLSTGCRQIAAIHSSGGSHLAQDQSRVSKVHLDNLNTTNVVEKKEEPIVLTNENLPASSYPGQPPIAAPVESSVSEVNKLQHKGANVECNLGQSNLRHENKLLGMHNLVGSSYPGQPAIAAAITSCSAEVVPEIMDGSTLGKRKKRNKKKKNKDPSKKTRNEGLLPGALDHPSAQGTPVHGLQLIPQ